MTDNVQSSLAEQRYVPLARTLCKISEVAKDDPLVHPESTCEICYVCQTLCEDLSATSDDDLLSDILAALDAIWNGCRMQLDQAALSVRSKLDVARQFGTNKDSYRPLTMQLKTSSLGWFSKYLKCLARLSISSKAM